MTTSIANITISCLRRAILMTKLIINPEYRIKPGYPDCNHERTVIKLGGMIYEFCDECGICWVRKDGKDNQMQ